MRRGRRRVVLIEKFLLDKPDKYTATDVFKPLMAPVFYNNDLFVQNRFSVELERSDGLKIDESRICGFKIETSNEKKILKVKTYLHIKEWITDYEKVVIAKISLFDNMGNEINNFDFDVYFDGYSIECEYSSSGLLTPGFSYVILEP